MAPFLQLRLLGSAVGLLYCPAWLWWPSFLLLSLILGIFLLFLVVRSRGPSRCCISQHPCTQGSWGCPTQPTRSLRCLPATALLQQCEAWGLWDKQPLLGVAVRRSLGRACSIWDPLMADPSTRIRSGHEEVTQQRDEKESPGTPQGLQGGCRDVFWNGHRRSMEANSSIFPSSAKGSSGMGLEGATWQKSVPFIRLFVDWQLLFP